MYTPTEEESPTEWNKNTLEHGVNAAEVCPECKTPASVGLFRRDVPVGHPDFGLLLKCNHPFHQEARKDRLMQLSQLGEEETKRKLSDILVNNGNRQMVNAAKKAVVQGYGWLYVWGGPGNAKSVVLQAVINEMNDSRRGPAIYTTFGELLDYVKQGYGDDKEDFISRLERLKDAPVLAIDEMDKVKETDWLHEFRFKFLDARYRSAINKESLTLFAGNPNPQTIFDAALYDRFRDGRFKIVQNTAPSARPAEKWSEQ